MSEVSHSRKDHLGKQCQFRSRRLPSVLLFGTACSRLMVWQGFDLRQFEVCRWFVFIVKLPYGILEQSPLWGHSNENTNSLPKKFQDHRVVFVLSQDRHQDTWLRALSAREGQAQEHGLSKSTDAKANQ